MPERLLIGAHLSTAQGLPAMLRTGVEIGATCAQIFTSSPRQWRGKRYTPAEAQAFLAAQAETHVAPIIAHESYLINLASDDPELLEKSRRAFDEEIDRCGMLRLPVLVIHWGSYKGGTLALGLRHLADSLQRALPRAEAQGVRIVLETTAGQGSYLGGDFAQFAQLFAMSSDFSRLGVCLDTCHVFAAGYDLRDAASYERLWDAFDTHVGLERLMAIHVNDSQRVFGSHADRHENIGQGELGLEAFRLLMRDPRFAGVPKILETPGDALSHRDNLAVLRRLAENSPV